MSTSSPSVLRKRLSSSARVKQIEAFVAVAELGSVVQAAARLGISQPGVTKHIKDLEGLLGVPLFLRLARGMTLSPTGQELLNAARRILVDFDDMAERTAALAMRDHTLVRVVASQGGISAVLSASISAFVQRHPQILLTVSEATPLELASSLARGEADLAICRQPDQAPLGWEFVPVREDELVIVAGPQHPLARHRRPVPLATLARETWMAWSLESRARKGFEELFKGREAPPLWPVSTRSPVILWSTLRSNNVVALLPASYLLEFLRSGQLARIPARLGLPLAPIGVMRPARASSAACRLADFIVASEARQTDALENAQATHHRRECHPSSL